MVSFGQEGRHLLVVGGGEGVLVLERRTEQVSVFRSIGMPGKPQ